MATRLHSTRGSLLGSTLFHACTAQQCCLPVFPGKRCREDSLTGSGGCGGRAWSPTGKCRRGSRCRKGICSNVRHEQIVQSYVPPSRAQFSSPSYLQDRLQLERVEEGIVFWPGKARPVDVRGDCCKVERRDVDGQAECRLCGDCIVAQLCEEGRRSSVGHRCRP